MIHDRADRIRELDVFPTGSGTPERVCIDYDLRGNVARVATGCSSACSLERSDSSSSCSGEPATSYVTDDFGNVVKVEGGGAFNVSTGLPGIMRFEFDALGNVVKQQTEAQRSDTYTTIHHTYQYDKLGRRTQMAEVWNGPWGPATFVVSEFSYDSNGTPDSSCAQPLRTNGRLRMSRDPLITHWFQYDQAGRVTREIRIPNQSSDPTPARERPA
jgi:YD repeat-containing protein